MKQVVVTDAESSVGRHLILQLLREQTCGVTVVARSAKRFRKLDRFLKKNSISSGRYRCEVADLSDFLDCRRVLQGVGGGAEVIYHSAAAGGGIGGGAWWWRCLSRLCRRLFGRKEPEAEVRRRIETVHHLAAAALELTAAGAKKPQLIYRSCATVPENNRYQRGYFWAETEVWRAAAHGLRVVLINARRMSAAAIAEAMRLKNRAVSEKNLIIRIKIP